jgi:hypothetical protein
VGYIRAYLRIAGKVAKVAIYPGCDGIEVPRTEVGVSDNFLSFSSDNKA